MSGVPGALVPRAEAVTGWLFDLDGVLTDTASLHVSAWKTTFDAVLSSLGGHEAPFDPVADYERYVDGRPRMDGARDFLASRGIVLPEGSDDAAPGAGTLADLVSRKDDLYLRLLRSGRARAFPDALELLGALSARGRQCAVVTASRHLAEVLEATGLGVSFGALVDGLVAAGRALRGKPAPDTYLHAAFLLGLPPPAAAVVEDAPAGVAAGRAGGFGLVVGVARRAKKEELLAEGADLVVARLTELLEGANGAGADGR